MSGDDEALLDARAEIARLRSVIDGLMERLGAKACGDTPPTVSPLTWRDIVIGELAAAGALKPEHASSPHAAVRALMQFAGRRAVELVSKIEANKAELARLRAPHPRPERTT